MPLYEYACAVCHARFDKLQPMNEALHTTCPDCGGTAQRVLSVFAAVSRGPGGETASVGGCACSAGGGCACSAG